MNQTDDLDRRIGRWLEESAPSEAPHTLLDETLSRTAELPQGGGGGWSPVLRLASVAAVAVLAVLAGLATVNLLDRPGVGADGSASPSITASAATSPTGTATPTVAPSDASVGGGMEQPGDVLLRYSMACDVVGGVAMPHLTILQDGRVIWVSQDDTGTGFPWVVRQLSEAGLATVRAAIGETGLLDTDGTYTFEHREGAPEAPGQGACMYAFAHRDGSVSADVTSLMWFGDEYEATYNEPDPERRALDAFARLIGDPDAWLSNADWAEPEARQYFAPAYLVTSSESYRENGTEADVADTDWPFDEPAATYGEVSGSAGVRCGVAPTDRIEAFLGSVIPPGGRPLTLPPMSEILLTDGTTKLVINLWPQMPDGHPGCEAVY